MIEGPYLAKRTWWPEAGLSTAQVNAAIVKLREAQQWKPLEVVESGKPDKVYPPKKPRTP